MFSLLNLDFDLLGATIHVGNNHQDIFFGDRCGYIGSAQHTAEGQWVKIPCKHQGQYVGIKGVSDTHYTLQLCEVRAFEGHDCK